MDTYRHLQVTYGHLCEEYEHLRAEYEAARAPFTCPVGVANVWRDGQVTGSERIRIDDEAHPCQKRVSHVSRIIQAHTRPGDMVLEPFGGTCRVAEACERLPAGQARRYVCIEPEQRWLEAVRPRLVTDPSAGFKRSEPGQLSLWGG